jgi:tetratricopeptide (TPR) repeat protein
MLLTVPFLAIAALVAVPAQESDEEIKRRILEKVRSQMEEKKKEILDRMAAVIDEELSGAPRKAPAAGGARDPRVREIERKLQQLDDQRDDLQRDLRAIRRESVDAKIIKDAKSNPPESDEQLQDEFQEAFQLHGDSTKELERDHEKAVKGFERSIAGFKRLVYALKDNPGAADYVATCAYNVACGYALSGVKDEAIDWLEISIKFGFKKWDHIRTDSDLVSIRKERRYLRLMADR